MKNTKYIAVLFLAVAIGCTTKKKAVTERKCSLFIEKNHSNDYDYDYDYTVIRCDSFQMKSTIKAVFWVDNAKMIVISEKPIIPEIN